MKQLLTLVILLISLTAITVHKYNSNDTIQMIVQLPELKSKDLQKDLESDINDLSGVKFLETSLMSRTMLLNYDSRKVSPNDIENILHKWGCNSSESSFRKLFP